MSNIVTGELYYKPYPGSTKSISGKVDRAGIPGRFVVWLLRRLDLSVAGKVLSEEDGTYTFTQVPDSPKDYLVVTVDHNSPTKNAAISDGVVPE